MPVGGIDQFKRHRGSAFHRIQIATGGAEAAVAAKRNKLKISAFGTAIHGATVGRVTTMDHLIHVFDNGIAWMKDIYHFFIMVGKNLLQDVHETIMKENGTKKNYLPS